MHEVAAGEEVTEQRIVIGQEERATDSRRTCISAIAAEHMRHRAHLPGFTLLNFTCGHCARVSILFPILL